MAIAQDAAFIRKLVGNITADEIREQLGEALDDPEATEGLLSDPSKIAGAASRLVTAQTLRAAWRSLIPSFGLTLLYLNVHFVARHVAHRKGFTPLGSEWRTWRTILGWPSFGLQYGEIIALILLDGLAAAAILMVIVLFTLVVWAVANPAEAVVVLGQGIIDLVR